MDDLSGKRCVPCEGNVAPLTREEAQRYLSQVSGWTLSEDARSISKKFAFKDFSGTMHFVNEIARIAQEENHHPDLAVSYGGVGVELSTHAIGGLSENDFILASKIDSMR
jgi:4a-hydroxytetrahydrobiopterin dehydratase